MKEKTLTYKAALDYGIRELEKAKIDDAHTDAFLLLSYVTNIDRAAYYMQTDKELNNKQYDTYHELIERRKSRIPLQHITKEQEFMGYKFFVNENVLIPRQDTEVLVEEASAKARDNDRILDMCTGSGCIIISLVKYLNETMNIREIKGCGADISKEALKVADINAARLMPEIELIRSDLFSNIDGDFNIIVSNPPYIKTDVIEVLEDEVRLHDPRIALDGKADGLYFYDRIIKEAKNYLYQGGYLMFEIGCDQADTVNRMMEDEGYTEITIKRDLSGLDRVVYGRLQ